VAHRRGHYLDKGAPERIDICLVGARAAVDDLGRSVPMVLDACGARRTQHLAPIASVYLSEAKVAQQRALAVDQDVGRLDVPVAQIMLPNQSHGPCQTFKGLEQNGQSVELEPLMILQGPLPSERVRYRCAVPFHEGFQVAAVSHRVEYQRISKDVGIVDRSGVSQHGADKSAPGRRPSVQSAEEPGHLVNRAESAAAELADVCKVLCFLGPSLESDNLDPAANSFLFGKGPTIVFFDSLKVREQAGVDGSCR
jgi:hypothetical protein